MNASENLSEKFNISTLVKCQQNFAKTLALSNELYPQHPDFSRQAVIKAYEIAIEVSWKTMQRWIQLNQDSNIHQKPKRELFRAAYSAGLISDPAQWWTLFEGRNKTAHIYMEDTAQAVYQMALSFSAILENFIKNIEARL